MNKILTATTAYNWYDILKELDYLKKHSSKETYDKVLKSFKRTAFSIVVICILFIIVLMSGMNHFDKQINSHVNDNNISYSHEKIGHIRSGVLYYIDNEKYEVDMSKYGYNINDYKSGTDFRIYLDENHRVVDIKPISDKEITSSEKQAYWIVGSLVSFSIILIVYAIWLRYSKSSLNPSKEYNKFGKWLETRDNNEEWYNG